MKIKIELYGASRDFSNQSFLDFEVDKNSTIKDIRNKLIDYFKLNDTFKFRFNNDVVFGSGEVNIDVLLQLVQLGCTGLGQLNLNINHYQVLVPGIHLDLSIFVLYFQGGLPGDGKLPAQVHLRFVVLRGDCGPRQQSQK